MNRIIWMIVLVGGVLPAATRAESRLSGETNSPNVILIISDDQAWTDFGFMGHDVIQTPHLDKLATRSAQFPRGYVPSSLCRPSLATIISGLYPHEHKVTGNDPPKGTDRRQMLRHIQRIPTLPRLLATQGYLSHQSGKWWEGGYELGGFTAGMTHGDPSRGGRHGDEGLKIGRAGMDAIASFLDDTGDKPFFLWYAPFLPHTPHNPPARLWDKYRDSERPEVVSRYYAMCEWFDETCGALLDEVDRRGKTDNTLVVFVTDNGWIAPPGRNQKGPNTRYGPKSKRSPYDGGIRTPILYSWPGHIAPGRYDTLVSSIDIAPTILAAAGLAASPEMSGINLLDVINAGGRMDRPTLFGEIFEHDVVDIDDPVPGLMYRWAIQDRWKVIIPAVEGAVELYDLSDDPQETTDLAKRHPDIVERLSSQAEAWWPARRAADK